MQKHGDMKMMMTTWRGLQLRPSEREGRHRRRQGHNTASQCGSWRCTSMMIRIILVILWIIMIMTCTKKMCACWKLKMWTNEDDNTCQGVEQGWQRLWRKVNKVTDPVNWGYVNTAYDKVVIVTHITYMDTNMSAIQKDFMKWPSKPRNHCGC